MATTITQMTRRGLFAALAAILFVRRVFRKATKPEWTLSVVGNPGAVLRAGDRLWVTLTAKDLPMPPLIALSTPEGAFYDIRSTRQLPLQQVGSEQFFIADRDYVVTGIKVLGAEFKALRIERNGDA